MNPIEKQRCSDNRLVKRLKRNAGRAIADFNMIGEGDKVMVCLSGGKDSYTLLDILLTLQKRAPVRFDLLAVNLDQKQPGFPADVLPRYAREAGVPFHQIEQDTYSVVRRVIPEGKTTCGLCSRLRRGALYNFARTHGVTRIALGHHRDDIIETLFLNLFNGGRLKAMPPKLLSDDGAHVVIRPLAYCSEQDIARYAELRQFPLIPCDLCGSQPNLQRQAIKAMLAQWKKQHPGRIENIFRAIAHVSPSQLADRELFDFVRLGGDGAASGDLPDWLSTSPQYGPEDDPECGLENALEVALPLPQRLRLV
jgi:tRNA 2-thiocytidine biosynthesis protein TtcA